MQALYDLATALGVRIRYANLSLLGKDGDYNTRTRTIRLNPGMLYRLERSVLAHELAHAVHDDELTILPHINEKIERRADEWAAHFLIDRVEYQLAADKFGRHIDHIAEELCVMPDLVVAYERTLERIGETVYISPKHGAGQWRARVEASA